MKLVQLLKLCVCAAFIATIITGTIFMARSSADERGGKQMKEAPHVSANIIGGQNDGAKADGADGYEEEQKPAKKGMMEKDIDEEEQQHHHEQQQQKQQHQHADDDDNAKNENGGAGGGGVLLPPPPQPREEAVAVAAATEEQGHPKNIKNYKQRVVLAQIVPTTPTPTTASSTIEHKVLKELKSASAATPPSIHIFYYPWYGSPAFNGGKFYHWNHRVLPGPNSSFKNGGGGQALAAHVPPGDIASVFYPSLGPYSSWDSKVIERHMKWMSSAGIDVVVCSWYPKGQADQEGTPWDALIPILLNATDKAKMKMAFHLEPYEDRTAATVRRDIGYILKQYGKHPALYRRMPATMVVTKNGGDTKQAKELPLFYVYDSYRIDPAQWATVLGQNGTDTIRGTESDALMIGLYVDKGDTRKLMDAAFDGLYTYFAADGFSHGSTMANWPELSAFCARNALLFVPSVGPGYNDTRVRPWNSANTRGRANGEYYREHFKMAHTAKADIVSITSFNEWHEGTQIEPAMPFTPSSSSPISTTHNSNNNGTISAALLSSAFNAGVSLSSSSSEYAKYDGGPEQYLEITLEMVKQYFTAHHEDIPAKIAPIV